MAYAQCTKKIRRDNIGKSEVKGLRAVRNKTSCEEKDLHNTQESVCHAMKNFAALLFFCLLTFRSRTANLLGVNLL